MHALPSSQGAVLIGEHLPLEQACGAHKSSVAHGLTKLSWMHPLAGKQKSAVHRLPSSQLMTTPPHKPLAQASVVVQALPSSQVIVPVAGLVLQTVWLSQNETRQAIGVAAQSLSVRQAEGAAVSVPAPPSAAGRLAVSADAASLGALATLTAGGGSPQADSTSRTAMRFRGSGRSGRRDVGWLIARPYRKNPLVVTAGATTTALLYILLRRTTGATAQAGATERCLFCNIMKQFEIIQTTARSPC